MSIELMNNPYWMVNYLDPLAPHLSLAKITRFPRISAFGLAAVFVKYHLFSVSSSLGMMVVMYMEFHPHNYSLYSPCYYYYWSFSEANSGVRSLFDRLIWSDCNGIKFFLLPFDVLLSACGYTKFSISSYGSLKFSNTPLAGPENDIKLMKNSCPLYTHSEFVIKNSKNHQTKQLKLQDS